MWETVFMCTENPENCLYSGPQVVEKLGLKMMQENEIKWIFFVKILFMDTVTLSPKLLSNQCNFWDFTGAVVVITDIKHGSVFLRFGGLEECVCMVLVMVTSLKCDETYEEKVILPLNFCDWQQNLHCYTGLCVHVCFMLEEKSSQFLHQKNTRSETNKIPPQFGLIST